MAEFDIIINNGLYFDGTGRAANVRSLGISAGKVALVSENAIAVDRAERVIDAQGKWITPGFVDTHTHYDAELIASPALSESVRHGVTTAMVGSCSLSMVCSSALDSADIFTRVETVPREKVLPILEEKKTWNSPKEWVDFVNQHPLGINLISMLGHSDLRTAVMGLHRATDRSVVPSDDEQAKMEAVLEEALQAGFVGLSTMRLKWDKVDGDREWSKSLPSTYARWREIQRFNKLLRKYGRVHQGAPNAANPLQIFQYLAQTVGLLGKPLKTTLISMLDLKGNPTLRPMAELAARAVNKLGGNFRWQLLPTPFSIYADGMDIVIFEEFGAGEMALDVKNHMERNELIKQEDYRRTFRKFYGEKLSPRVWQRDFGDAVILDCPNQAYVGRNFADIAMEKGIHVVDLFLDMVVEFGNKLRWFTVIGNHNAERLQKMVQNPDTLITFSDAGAHIRNMAFYNLPLRFLKMVKQSHDRGNPIMPMEKAVWRMTGEQADWFGIPAGKIREGDRADLVVLDPNKLDQDLEKETWADMQNFGLERMVCRNPGIVPYVLVNGRIAVDEEQINPALGSETGFGQFLPAS